MNKQFMIVSNNRIYICDDIQQVHNKTKALSTFNIDYKIYYKIKDEWVEMLVSPTDILCAVNMELKGV